IDNPSRSVRLTGPAEFVFEGTIEVYRRVSLTGRLADCGRGQPPLQLQKCFAERLLHWSHRFEMAGLMFLPTRNSSKHKSPPALLESSRSVRLENRRRFHLRSASK